MERTPRLYDTLFGLFSQHHAILRVKCYRVVYFRQKIMLPAEVKMNSEESMVFSERRK